MIRHPQVKLYHLKPQTLKHVEIIKVSDKPTFDTSVEWNGFDLEITGFNYHIDQTPQLKLYHLKRQNLTHVEFIKVSDKPSFDKSLERFWLGDHRFCSSP